jgi:hypothetical protein
MVQGFEEIIHRLTGFFWIGGPSKTKTSKEEKMKMMMTAGVWVFVVAAVLLCVACGGDPVSETDTVTMRGQLTEDNRFIDDSGTTYALAVTQKAEEAKTLSGQRIEVTGTLMEQQGEMVLSVIGYQLVE